MQMSRALRSYQNLYDALRPTWRFCGSGKKNARSVVVEPGTLACAGLLFTY